MKIKLITEKTLWQKFFEKNCLHSFLQSWEWGEFQKSLDYVINRLGLYNHNNQLEAICLIVKIKSKRGNFLFVPHGPIISNYLISNTKHIKKIIFQLLKFLKEIAKQENYWFIRIAPIFEDKKEYQKIFSDLGFKTAPIYMHAETTWELDLFNKTEEELLYNMRKTTRYLIKKAIRDGVIIEKTTNPKALEIFYHLYQQTAKREKFTPFSFDYIKKEFKAFSKSNNVMIFLALTNNKKPPIPVLNNLGGAHSDFTSEEHAQGSEKRGIKTFINQYLAASIIIFTKNAAFYHQGASLHTKIPATYLLQWEAIKEAKNRDCLLYNFWGIYDEKRKDRTPKSWQGLTLFKTGFSGQIQRFLPTQDYVISKKYYLTYLWERFLMWKRRR